MIYRKFKTDPKIIQALSTEDREIIRILAKVVKRLIPLYEYQVKSGFYPKNINKSDLEKAANKNPSLVSPFTYVEKKNNKLVSVPYHIKHKEQLTVIASEIKKAAALSKNLTFKRYLQSRAKSLLDGSYKEADIAWLKVKNSSIDFNIGPVERYIDTILFTKRAYQAHVGITDFVLTTLARETEYILYATANSGYDTRHTSYITKKGVEVVVEHTPETSGLVADILFGGEHFPADLTIMQEYGSKIILYLEQIKYKFTKLHYPIFKAIFEKRFASKYTQQLLLEASTLNTLVYELGRQLHKYAGARTRLKELYRVIDEANSYAAGIQHSKYLVLKGVVSQDQLEAMIITHIVWIFSNWKLYQQNMAVESYARANAIGLNMYLESGALREKNGISWPNFSRMFFVIEQLAKELGYLLEKGSYEEAEQFIKKQGSLDNLERMAKKLPPLTAEI